MSCASRASVELQLEAGVDVVNDGQVSKVSYATYATYVTSRLAGFGQADDVEANFALSDLVSGSPPEHRRFARYEHPSNSERTAQ